LDGAIEANPTGNRIAAAVRNAKKCQGRVERLNCGVSETNSGQDRESIQHGLE
jgi:hypothetical protein